MWIADNWKDYAVLDCGGGEKIERWGSQIFLFRLRTRSIACSAF